MRENLLQGKLTLTQALYICKSNEQFHSTEENIRGLGETCSGGYQVLTEDKGRESVKGKAN